MLKVISRIAGLALRLFNYLSGWTVSRVWAEQEGCIVKVYVLGQPYAPWIENSPSQAKLVVSVLNEVFY